MKHTDTVLYLVLLVSEMPRAEVEAHFLKKLAFPNNKCLAQDAFGECARTTENLSKYTAARECVLVFSYILQSSPSKWAISVTEMLQI